MFCNERNYSFFLKQYDKYLTPLVDTYTYCLLGNHFHLMVRIKPRADLVHDADLTTCHDTKI
ncbi:MAG: hypothetical protein SGJ10_06200 [Bacteroidota bacterium]|nr:hypothetical protein [Bacteroidota bacterium]